MKIEFDVEKINKLLGTDISRDEANRYLERLGFKINDNIAVVPSYRASDVKIWQDLAEEIARIYGYNKITKIQIACETKFKSQNSNLEFQKREHIKDVLKGFGFTEIYSYSFAERDNIKALGSDVARCVEIANLLSPETQYLRPSILPSLLAAIAKNPWAPEVNIFEIGKMFTPSEERWQLGMALTGKDGVILKKALEALNIESEVQNVSQEILDKYKIRKPVKYILVDLETINIEAEDYSRAISKNKYRKISVFAPTVRDLAFIVNEDIVADEVAKAISNMSDKIFLVELFDEYSSDTFGLHKKNLAFHLWLQDMDGPVKDKDTEKIIGNITSHIENQFQAKLRSK